MFATYHDEDSQDTALVTALRSVGFDCLTTNEADMRGSSDEDQLVFAAEQGGVLLTSNTRDFRPLNTRWWREGRRHAGIIVLMIQQTPIGVQVRALEAMAIRFSADQMSNQLEFLLNYR